MTHEVAGLEIVWSFTPLLSTHRCLPPGESGFCRNMRDHSDVGQTFEWLFEVSLCSYWCYSPVFLADIVIQTDLSTLKIKFTKSAGQVDKLLLFLRWGLSTVDERERERLWSPGSEDELDPSVLWEKAHILFCFEEWGEVRSLLDSLQNLNIYASPLPIPQSPLWWAFTVSKATCRVEERGLVEEYRKRKQDKMQN